MFLDRIRYEPGNGRNNRRAEGEPRGSLVERWTGLRRLRDTLIPTNAEPILPAYQKRRDDSLAGSLLIATAIIYASVSGYFLGVYQQYLLQQFLAPCLILAGIALWALPDRTGVSHKLLERGFFALIIANALWPIYLAIAVPGLPWITVSRLILLATLLNFGIVLATDRDARSTMGEIFRKGKPIKICLITFIASQFISLAFSGDLDQSVGTAINSQLYWTGPLLVAMLICAKSGRIDIFAKCLIATAVALCVIAVWEHRISRLPWVGHIPSFLQVSDPVVAGMLNGGRRGPDGPYRVQTTFTTSLSSAEYMAMIIPFVIHYFFSSRRMWVKLLLVLIYIGAIFTIYVSRSRLGMVGLGVVHLAYPLLVGIRRRATIRNDLIGPSMIALYPALLAGFAGALLASHRLYVMFLGGAQHQSSNDARETMFQNSIPLIIKNPIGYGADQGAGVLNYRLPSGMLTIDSYYLSIVLDYGVIGFLAFYGMILYAIYLCVRIYFTSPDREAQIAGPVALSLGAYFVIKSVLSQSQNQYLMYALIGVALALNYRFYKQPPARVTR